MMMHGLANFKSTRYIYSTVNSSRRFSCKEETRSGLTAVKHDTFFWHAPSFQQTVNAKKVTPIMKIVWKAISTQTQHTSYEEIYIYNKMYHNTLVLQCIFIITQ